MKRSKLKQYRMLKFLEPAVRWWLRRYGSQMEITASFGTERLLCLPDRPR